GASPPRIHWYQFAGLAAAIVVDLARTTVSLRSARRYGSAALRANAYHFAGDLAGSLTVLFGLLVVRAGFGEGDSIAALLVAAIICAAAARLVAENANVLMDRTPAEARAAAEQAIARLGIDVELSRLRLRESAGRYFADVVVTVPPGQAVVEGHEAANEGEAALEDALPGSDVVVHVEPLERPLAARAPDAGDEGDARDRIERLVHEHTGVRPHSVKLLSTEAGRVVFLTLGLDREESLPNAHRLAGELEDELRQRIPDIADVVIH